MSDRMRWRYGDTNPVVAAVDPATVIEIGDLLWLDIDDAKPAALLPDLGCTLVENRERFAQKFLGAAMQRSRAGDSGPIRVATTGVFEFHCPIQSFELGNLVGVDGRPLANQAVTLVGLRKDAIGRVCRRAFTSTSVLVDIRSTVMTGGILPR